MLLWGYAILIGVVDGGAEIIPIEPDADNADAGNRGMLIICIN